VLGATPPEIKNTSSKLVTVGRESSSSTETYARWSHTEENSRYWKHDLTNLYMLLSDHLAILLTCSVKM